MATDAFKVQKSFAQASIDIEIIS